MLKNDQLNCQVALFKIIYFAKLPPKDFAQVSGLGLNTILSCSSDWNPKFGTVRKIMETVNLPPHIFYSLALGKSVDLGKVCMKYPKDFSNSIKNAGRILNFIRCSYGFTQIDFARKTTVNIQTVYHKEHVSNLDSFCSSTLVLYAKTYGFQIDMFILLIEMLENKMHLSCSKSEKKNVKIYS